MKKRFELWTWLPYVAPMALFLLLTDLESRAPTAFYPWLYGLKIIFVSGALWMCRAVWRDIRWDGRVLPLSISVGIAVFGLWIGLDKAIPYPHLGARTGLNPFSALENDAARALFLCSRFYGLVLMVPLMEELFWRSFLLRYATEPEFEKLPVGTFSNVAFALVAGAFGLAHSEWLVAIIAAAIYALLLRKTESLFACIIAHGVTNLCLGIYVLSSGDWKYW